MLLIWVFSTIFLAQLCHGGDGAQAGNFLQYISIHTDLLKLKLIHSLVGETTTERSPPTYYKFQNHVESLNYQNFQPARATVDIGLNKKDNDTGNKPNERFVSSYITNRNGRQ